jgi:hypothetical protein
LDQRLGQPDDTQKNALIQIQNSVIDPSAFLPAVSAFKELDPAARAEVSREIGIEILRTGLPPRRSLDAADLGIRRNENV